MTGAKYTTEWLEHRVGLRKLSCHPRPCFTRALESNGDKGSAFIDSYGKKEIKGFVGFVDLIGFSTKVVGLSPMSICDYLRPRHFRSDARSDAHCY